jgi:Ca-activated chloride channel family protein
MRARYLAVSLTLLILGLSYAALPALDAKAMQAPASGMTYLRVSVIDNKKVPVATLKAEHFVLTEDNKEQKVAYFSAPGEPASLGVILALSASGPVKVPGQKDRVSVDILTAVDRVREAFGANNAATTVNQVPLDSDGVYNVVAQNISNLDKQANPRKALVIVSDGMVPSGVSPERMPVPKALVESARVLNFPIYFLFPVLNRPEPALTEQSQYVVGYYLEQIAEYSGGELLVGQIENDLIKVAENLRDTVKNMYILGFTSTNTAKDGKWRKLTVKLTPAAGSNLKVSARERYYVNKP